MKESKIGFTIGKFAPLHKGHEYLIETGIKEMDKFLVIVYDSELINISTEERANWIREKYPNCEVRIAHNPPSQYGLDKESVNIQMKYLNSILGDYKPTHFYSSEKYGKSVADYLNIIDRQVDSERINFPISASKIRNNLEEKKIFMDKNVYNDYKKSLKTD